VEPLHLGKHFFGLFKGSWSVSMTSVIGVYVYLSTQYVIEIYYPEKQKPTRPTRPTDTLIESITRTHNESRAKNNDQRMAKGLAAFIIATVMSVIGLMIKHARNSPSAAAQVAQDEEARQADVITA